MFTTHYLKGIGAVLLVCLLSLPVLAAPAACVLYVDASATGANDGSNWENAYVYLQDALAAATSGCVIKVACGVYYPDQITLPPDPCDDCCPDCPTPGDREASFVLKNGVTIEGGYLGNTREGNCCNIADPNQMTLITDCCCECEDVEEECSCCAAPCGCKTILSGDISEAGNPADNSYHVVWAENVDQTAVLRNVVVEGGTADGQYPHHNGGGMFCTSATPLIQYCCFRNNFASDAGGGIFNSFNGSPLLIQSHFCQNTATWGGAMANFLMSSPLIQNCVIFDNAAFQTGGGINNDVLSDPRLENTTVVNNTAGPTATGIGGGMYSNSSDPLVYNCIFWGNLASQGPQIAIIANNRRTRIGYCDIQGGKPQIHLINATVVWETPVMNLDPMFVDPLNCNFRLRTGSPCLDASNNTLLTGTLRDLDRDATDRFVALPAVTPPMYFGVIGAEDGIADLGAYERPSVIYVNAAVADPNASNDGSSWANAFPYLQDALAAAQPADQIWVAQGTYTPDRFWNIPNLRYHPEIPFNLLNEVTLLGGFVATETDITDRPCDPKTNPTVLSGDLLGDDVFAPPFGPTSFENSWNILFAGPNINSTAVLDGFIIRSGYANGTAQNTPWNKGGGMHCLGSPVVKCCLFDYNWAYDQGGAVYNQGGSPRFLNTVFQNNFTRLQGAGLCNIGGNVTLYCCTFDQNTGSYSGGGMFNRDGSVVAKQCVFTNNGAVRQHGGAMANVRTRVLICDSAFEGNRADQDGGAVANLNSQVRMFQVWYQANVAGDDGGGIYSEGTSLLCVNGGFCQNTATGSFGGGICTTAGSVMDLVNCSFNMNSAMEGGAVYNGFSSPFHLSNAILWGDSAFFGNEISLEECQLFVRRSDLMGGEPAISVWGDVAIHRVDFVLDIQDFDPLFIGACDLRLQPLSPAIDAGLDAEVPGCVDSDLAGTDRFLGTVDMGAYEFPLPPVPRCATCLGDANGDSIVDIIDLIDIVNRIMPTCPDYSVPGNGCGDMDDNGVVDLTDLIALVNLLMANAPNYSITCP